MDRIQKQLPADILVRAVIAGGNNFAKVETFGKAKHPWLKADPLLAQWHPRRGGPALLSVCKRNQPEFDGKDKAKGQGEMMGFYKGHSPAFVLALAILLLGWIIPLAHADEPDAATTLVQAPTADKPGAPPKSKEAPDKGEKEGGAAAGQKFDPAVVSTGMAAFQRSCTTCHDAARSLERTKDLAGWRATVKRMAAKRGADVGSGDIEPIAVYLASRTAAATAAPADKEKAAAERSSDTASLSTFATLSPQWRGGHNDLQNPGFGPLAWVGASWQGKIVSARVTLCVTCHGVQEPGLISRIEPVEAAVRVDLSEFLGACVHGMKGGVDAGRIVVPFGAFAAQTNPGSYRTVSTPLIFNMGQRIFSRSLGFPVLPMPYADQGLNLNLDVPLCDLGTGPITATMDSYLVNGLQGSSNGVDFFQSRNLFDYNNRVAGGGRLTVGDPYIRAGASFMTGRFDDPSASDLRRGLTYRIYGFDVQAHYKRLIRCQFEYARRDGDRLGIGPIGPQELAEGVYGYYMEAEARPWDKCRVSLLTRYDSQRRSSQLPTSGTSLATRNNVERFTVGVNVELWHQSLLMVNFERWLVPEPAHRTPHVFGVRYTITF